MTERQAAIAAPDPDPRPRVDRRAMRVLVVDTNDAVLLFHDSDPDLTPVPRFWITPGGGVDPGESDVEAAVREVAEETGLVIGADDLVGPIAKRVVLHGFSDVIVTQDELFWFVRCAPFEVSIEGHTELELTTMTAHHWWTRAELESTTDEIWPADLLQILDQVGPGDTAPTEPLDLGHVDESTVAPS
jgi:8-oxo-dGTP pyrophosphatase MutT (NUDIX family)